MVDHELAQQRPALFRSSPLVAPVPRLRVGAVAALSSPQSGSGQQSMHDQPLAPDSPAGEPPAHSSSPRHPQRAVRESRPGEIVLPPARRSLARLFKLEQEIAELPGVGDAMVSVTDEGYVVITVPPHAEVRVREFLVLAGEISHQAATDE